MHFSENPKRGPANKSKAENEKAAGGFVPCCVCPRWFDSRRGRDFFLGGPVREPPARNSGSVAKKCWWRGVVRATKFSYKSEGILVGETLPPPPRPPQLRRTKRAQRLSFFVRALPLWFKLLRPVPVCWLCAVMVRKCRRARRTCNNGEKKITNKVLKSLVDSVAVFAIGLSGNGCHDPGCAGVIVRRFISFRLFVAHLGSSIVAHRGVPCDG